MIYKLSSRDKIILNHSIFFYYDDTEMITLNSLELALIQFNFGNHNSNSNSTLKTEIEDDKNLNSFKTFLNRRINSTKLISSANNNDSIFIPKKYRKFIELLRKSNQNLIISGNLENLLKREKDEESLNLIESIGLKEFINRAKELGLINIITDKSSKGGMFNKKLILRDCFVGRFRILPKVIETPPPNQPPSSVLHDLHLIDLSFSLDNLYSLSCEQLLAIQFRPDTNRKSSNPIYELSQDIFIRRYREFHDLINSSFSSNFNLDDISEIDQVPMTYNEEENSLLRSKSYDPSNHFRQLQIPYSHPLFKQLVPPFDFRHPGNNIENYNTALKKLHALKEREMERVRGDYEEYGLEPPSSPSGSSPYKEYKNGYVNPTPRLAPPLSPPPSPPSSIQPPPLPLPLPTPATPTLTLTISEPTIFEENKKRKNPYSTPIETPKKKINWSREPPFWFLPRIVFPMMEFEFGVGVGEGEGEDI